MESSSEDDSWARLDAILGEDRLRDDLEAPLPFLETLALVAIGVVEGFDWKSCSASSSSTLEQRDDIVEFIFDTFND